MPRKPTRFDAFSFKELEALSNTLRSGIDADYEELTDKWYIDHPKEKQMLKDQIARADRLHAQVDAAWGRKTSQ